LSDAFYPLSNGNIAYVFNKGIFSFDPLHAAKTSNTVKTHLTSISVNGKVSPLSDFIDQIDTLKLTHTENNFTVEFAATNYLNASATIYSYMLEGNDNSWSASSRTRTVNFSQLTPGNYRLRIRAGENSPEKILFIEIIPAWWQTVWFRWLVVLSIIAALFYSIRFYLSIRYRERIAQLERQREIEGIRMRISRDIHDEIGSGLTKIKLMSRNLSRATTDSDAMKETSVKISSASDELIQNLSEIVWTVNPANDSLENVFAFTRNYLSKLFEENSDVKLILDFPEPAKIPQDVSLNPEVKRNLILILKEAMTNTFKHAQASEVKVALQADKSKIEMSIKDNGKGISDESHNGFGNGLKNMRKRAESINAQFNFESSKGSGTSIHIYIPLGKS
jgi:signal transduction histidine kinase